jgi:hypothetical protein
MGAAAARCGRCFIVRWGGAANPGGLLGSCKRVAHTSFASDSPPRPPQVVQRAARWRVRGGAVGLQGDGGVQVPGVHRAAREAVQKERKFPTN